MRSLGSRLVAACHALDSAYTFLSRTRSVTSPFLPLVHVDNLQAVSALLLPQSSCVNCRYEYRSQTFLQQQTTSASPLWSRACATTASSCSTLTRSLRRASSFSQRPLCDESCAWVRIGCAFMRIQFGAASALQRRAGHTAVVRRTVSYVTVWVVSPCSELRLASLSLTRRRHRVDASHIVRQAHI